MPANMDFRTEYAVVKKAHPNDIVLYQLGDFYEMFGPDARVASHELDLMLTQRNLPDVGRVAMCGFPAQQLDERVQKLRARHDVTVSSIGVDWNRLTVSYLSVEQEARNIREAEVPAPEESVPVHVPEALPPIPALAPAREAAQEDIDAALQAWNGDADSKRAVASYMKDHAREKDTAAWLCREYGGGLPAFPVKLPGVNQYRHLPWPKVQRRIAQLVKEDRFFTEAELEHFADVDTAAVREQLEQGGDQPSPFAEQVIADVEQITASQDMPALGQGPAPEPPPTIRQIYARYKPMVMDLVLTDRAYRNACKNSDRENAVIEGHAAVTRAAEAIRDTDFMRLYFDMAGFRNRLHREIIDETYPVLSQPQQEQAEVPVQPVTSEGDTIATGSGDAVQEFIGAADLPPHDPLAPPYRVGDTVYLDKTAFEITNIGASEVQLRDLALPIPLLRAESKINFERQLHLDPRNSHITCYLPADLAYLNDDIQEEYTAARASTLNAHYTSPVVIKAIYEAIDKIGFNSGNILEPACGVGNFFGLLPESMAASKLYGVELDSITGRIAQQLYPQACIAVRGYEKTSFPKDFFDLAVGNVPFGQYSVSDREYNKLGFNIHNYFFAKTLDRVRPGGVIAFVTSRYTLDSKDSTVRKYLAARADLLGAIRLPNNAFKANAGTVVVSDIIFLQKRDTPAVEEPAWVQTGENADGFRINRYFIEHPEMILGKPSAESTQYGRQDFTVEPIQGLQLADQLHDAVKCIHGEYREAAPPELDENIGEMEITAIPADPGVKNYTYAIVDGEIYYRENSIMVKPALTASARERVTAMIGLRECVRELIDLQMDEYTTDSAIREKQGELDRRYDAFSKKFGLINDRANRLAFDRDSSYYLLCSLEVLDDDGQLKRKADMFTKRTIKQNTRVTSVDTAMDALAASIGERARVDMPFMAQLTGKSEAELEQELTGVIFRDIYCAENPDLIPKAFVDLDRYPFVTADEYLSGNVRQKLRMAQALYDVTPPDQQQRVRPNVEALTAAQPKDLDASEIEVRLGTDWIDKKYIQQFMYETLKTPSYLRGKIKVNRSKHTTEWAITCKGSVSDNDIAAYTPPTEPAAPTPTASWRIL